MRCGSGAGLGGAVRESRSLCFGVTTKVERVGAAIYGEGDLVDVLWLIVSAVLVLIMQGGFACLESGLVRAKNKINVVVKNVVDVSLTGLHLLAVRFCVDVWAELGRLDWLRRFHAGRRRRRLVARVLPLPIGFFAARR